MKLRRILLAVAVFIAHTLPLQADITTATLRIEGAGLKVVTTEVTAGIDMPTTVQTEFGGKQNDEAVSGEGIVVVGELTGPSLDTPIQLTTAPGYKFQIPGLPQKGVYYLQNIRLMRGTEFLQYATPAVSVLTVADLLQTKVSVRQLTPEELRARGITVDARNFDVYEYSFTFIIDGQEVVIPFPVIIDPRTHEVQKIPGEAEYTLPPTKMVEPPRWSPPQVIALDFGEDGELPPPSEEEKEREPRVAPPKIPAAIVIPNSLAVLHQFFAVAVTVTNGAPEGSAARLEDIKATIRIPTALRTVKTTPQVSFGQPVPIVEPTTGVTFLVAQARGEAEWTLEGLQPGTHRLDFDLRATLKQQGQDDIPMRATPSAAIVVHDPRFNINFSHPDTVRTGIEYSTYAFITNMSGTEQSITVKSGVESCDENPNANVCRLNGETTDLLTIPANDMRFIEYRLRPNVTGHVFATAGTLSSTDNLSASVSLQMGVSETGVPLSPATLLMPYYAQFVNPDVVSNNLMLFGLGYSLATAPLNQMTAKFPRVITTDVFQRAVDIARAGQRIFITDADPDAKRDTIAHLALDLLGNGGYELREWDALRRQEKSGRLAGASVMRELEATGLAGGATMTTFFDAFAAATAHRHGFAAALVHGTASGTRPYALSLVGHASGRRVEVPNEAASGWIRELAFADVSRFSGAGENGELGIAARWIEGVDVKVTPAADGPFQLEIVYPNAEDGSLQKAHFEISGTKDDTVVIELTRGATELNAVAKNGAIVGVGTITTVEPPPIRILGARQDLHLDKDAHKVSVLFSRPVAMREGDDLRTKFIGAIDFNRDGVVYNAPRPISAAALQEDGRVVNTTFDHSLSINATYTIDIGSLIDPMSGAPVSFPTKIAPKIDNDSPAGVIYGHVVKGDNTPVAGADVVIRQYLPNDGSRDPNGAPQYDVSQSDGAFLFEYIRRQIDANWTGAYRLEAFHSVLNTTRIEGSVRLPGKVHYVTLQYLGRGTAEGYVRYDDGSVVADAQVVIGSTMFSQFRTAKSDARGYYRIADLPVGPLTFSATDTSGNVTYAANEIATPGQLVTQNLSIYRQPFPGLGRVYGFVRVLRNEKTEPMAGVHVGVYSQGYGLKDGYTDANGRFEFDRVPAGFVTVLAEEWSVVRQSVAADIDLKADEIKQQDLLFVVPPSIQYATLTGEVWRENPLQPGVNERVPGALVKIEGYRVVTADAEGKFVYENIPTVLSGKTITAYDPATKRVNDTFVVPTLTEEGPNHVAVYIKAFDRGTGTIRVRLLDAGGRPVSGYRVIIPGFPSDVLAPLPTEPGVYEYRDVPVGPTYTVKAVPSGIRPTDGTPDPRPYGDQMASGNVSVQFNGHIAALTLRLPGQGTVRVKVRSQFDLITPVNLTYPVWYEAEQRTMPETLTESTEKNREADWAVFTNIPALSRYDVASAHPQYGYAGVNSQLAFDGDFNEHVLQLNTLAVVRGTVYAIDGVTPVAGASVTIQNGRSDPGSQLTGPDGRFEFVDQPSDTYVTVTAQVTQSGVYRTGYATALTPKTGGVVEGMSVVMRKRGFVDGTVVYKDYKRFDPDNVANNIADDTPNDYSDNAPVPLAKFYLRELDFPQRSFGKATEPLQTDTGGRFVINNVFVGSLRATAWDPGNEELRGDWTGSIDEEGAEAAPKAYIAVGGGGVGTARITVVDPNQSYLEVPNAEVSISTAGGRSYDFSSTDFTGNVDFTELPVGTYSVSAYSKALGKTSRSESISIVKDGLATARLELEFTGKVDGKLTDREAEGAPVPGAVVQLGAMNYRTQASTDADGFFVFQGVREGTFTLDAKDTDTNRRAHAERTLSVLDSYLTVNLELEPTRDLYFAAYLPDDYGNKSDVLAPPVRAEAVQRCWKDLGGTRHCDYERQLNGNPIVFPSLMENSGYGINIWQSGDQTPSLNLSGSFPVGSDSNPYVYVYPAYGEVHVQVTQADAPASGAKVTIGGAGKSVVVYTDVNGIAIGRDIRLGDVWVQAVSLDGKFTGTLQLALQRQSVPATGTIRLGTYAGLTGIVEAETGGPSVGTRVVANYAGHSAEFRTDGDGRYTFLGIPTSSSGPTSVSLVFIGPDDTTVGATASKDIAAGDGVATVATVKLDATSPQLESIAPEDGAMNASPDASVVVTFSEPVTNINANTFQLIDADGGVVNCAFKETPLADGKYAVSMIPANPPAGFPLKSNALYRVIVSNAVKDRTGHPLPAPRGFTFTTSDYAEPRVQKVLPASPIPAATTFEFRFNEPIDPTPWQDGGNGVFHIYKLVAPGGATAAIEKELVADAFTDPASNMTLYIAPNESNPIVAESFYRVVFDGVRDPQGNLLAEQIYHFYSFDEVAPAVVFVNPPASEQLVSGSEYEIRVELHNGSATGSMASDIRKVDYYTVAADGAEKPFAIVTQAPFSTKILGPEAPASGTTLTVGAQATDTSGNLGPKTRITWTVKPNVAPQNVVVTPDQVEAYPSTQIGAKVTFTDEGSFASVTMTFTVPTSAGVQTKTITQSYTRLASGAWPDVHFAYTVPNTAQAGANVTLAAVVTDVRGLASAPVDATIAIKTDTIQPLILATPPPPGTSFFNTDKYTITAIVSDAETSVQSVTFLVDGEPVATASSTAGPNPGQQTFKSVQVETRSKADDASIPIVVTAKDFAGNTRSKAWEVVYKGVNDPEAPKVTWLCPVDRGAIPALATNFALKLRVNVVDEDVRSVKFLIGNDGTSVTGSLVTNTTDYAATYTFPQTPSPGPLTITAVVEDTVAAHTVNLPLTVDAVTIDITITDPQAITTENSASFNGKSIAVSGTNAVLAPQVPLTLTNLLVLNGGRVETLPATISREFKVDVTTSGVAYIDCDSSINVSKKGYVGGWANTSDGQNADSHGRTVGNTTQGGADDSSQASHAGLGGVAPTGTTNAPYGSITVPTDLGSGGGGSKSCCNTGASGGGAIALRGTDGETDASRIVIGGSIRADGGHGYESGTQHAGGSGGSVLMTAKQVLAGPNAVISANGGDDDGSSPGSWGAGGGRVSISATTKLDVGTAVVEARGGRDYGQGESRNVSDGGAGTVFIRRPGQEAGEITVSSYDSRYPNSIHVTRPTPVGRIESGTSTAISANSLTDSARKFDRWMIGEELVIDGHASHTFTVVGVSADGGTLQTDPADGSLLDGRTAQEVPYSGLVAFDRVTVGKRALVVFDDHVAVTGVVNDKSSMAIDATAAVVLRDENPALTLSTKPAAGGNIVLDTTVSATYSISAAAGIRSVQIFWSLDGTQRIDTFNDYPPTTSTTVSLPVPSTAPLGPATLKFRVVDRAGRIYDLDGASYIVTENASPTIDNFVVNPIALQTYAGHDVTATITATDDIAVKSVTMNATLAGSPVLTVTRTPNTPAATETFVIPIPNDTPGGATVQMDVAVSDGFAGRSSATASQIVAILTDANAPSVSITSPTGASYRETVDKIPVRATTTDAEVAVREVTAQFDGGTPVAMTRYGTTNEWRVDLTAPPVDGDADITRQITVTSKDYAGNARTSEPVAVTIKPVVDANAPVLKWLCTAPGAMYPPGTTVRLRVSAAPANLQSPDPVQSVSMTLNGTTELAVSSIGNNQYEATFVIPADAADETSYNVRVTALSAGGAPSDLPTSFSVAVPTVAPITANTTIDATNTTYDNQTVVVQGGTVTVIGPHTFDRLLVLGGWVVAPVQQTLDLTTTRGTYVACGGSITMDGRGYTRNATEPNVSRPGNQSGGSHIGVGGLWDGPVGGTFDSVYRPSRMGGGGGNGGTGAGVIVLHARSFAVDGTVTASGFKEGDVGGAGGAIALHTGRISGGGRIEADGGAAYYGAGAGGAVAIYYTDPTSAMPTISAKSGAAGVQNRFGGAGSIYTFGPSSTHGDLTLDNSGSNWYQQQATSLPALGNGTAQPGTGGAVVVTTRVDVPQYFVEHWVEVRDRNGALKGTWRISSVDKQSFTLSGDGVQIVEGDQWQGVYRFDSLTTRNARLESVDPIRVSGIQTIDGVLETNAIDARDLRIGSNAVLRHVDGAQLEINLKGELRIDSGGAIDVSGLGYKINKTYPGATVAGDAAGGSHIGIGGVWGAVGGSFGSVYRPAEAGGGAGNGCCDSGGGIVRITAAAVVMDGTIRANGVKSSDRGGAGGAVWIKTGQISGGGRIEADGGAAYYGAGAGGAVAIYYADPTSVIPAISAKSGAAGVQNRFGGAGSIYTFGPSSTYGDLLVDNTGFNWYQQQATSLPSLGSGTAQPGTSGSVVVTTRADIPQYFAGHWVEVRDVSGALKGTWRISSVDKQSFTLSGDGVQVAEGDRWQGVYRFDSLTTRNARLESHDPIRVTGIQTIDGVLETNAIDAGDLRLGSSAVLRHVDGAQLEINLKGELRIESGGAIDVSGLGYKINKTYPGATVAGDAAGGSHIGIGGVWGAVGGSFGSVYRPAEAGGGAGNGCCDSGGGVVRIVASAVVVDGTIRANGVRSSDRGGAGGAVWITTGRISGGGRIEADGGAAYYGAGAGGAVAIYYTDPTSAMPTISAKSGAAGVQNRFGGAGSIYTFGPSSTYGDLLVDNTGFNWYQQQMTSLPALGKGTAQPGTGGPVIVTALVGIPQYFVGHWVEVRDRNGALKGTWRISSVDKQSFTLSGDGVQVVEGDQWQGVYRFDSLTTRNARLESVDPIRVSGIQTIDGVLETNAIDARDLRIGSNAVLRHVDGAQLEINLKGELRIESGGAIDVSGMGYKINKTYPGATVAGDAAGGSHIGIGGVWGAVGGSFGSVYRPAEAGGGAGNGCCDSGGGVVRIMASAVVVDGTIRANGVRSSDRGGAGGAVWITTSQISGGGRIEADGGAAYYGAGAGGAVAIYYADPTSAIPTISAKSGAAGVQNRFGGAGSIYTFGPSSTYGNLLIDNTAFALSNAQATVLPSLGRGRVLGVDGDTVLTDRITEVPAYLVGHWVDIYSSGGTRKGTWRIASVSGRSFTLEANGGVSPSAMAGDTYRGVYLFDNLVAKYARILLLDDVRYASSDLQSGSTLSTNDPPVFDESRISEISVRSMPDADFVVGPAGMVSDLQPPIVMTATNVRTAQSFTANASGDGSFSVPVNGQIGDTFTIQATDSLAGLPASSRIYDVSGAITNVNGVAAVTLQPATTTGGTTVTGSVRLLYPTHSGAPITVALSSSSANAVVPSTVVVPPLGSSAPFSIATSAVSSDTNVTITAATGVAAQQATLTLVAGSSTLVSLSLDAATIEGGGMVTATATLGAPAPAGGAVIALMTSDSAVASVPPSVVVSEGETVVSFTVLTHQRESAGSADISAFYGARQTQTLTVTACTSMEAVAPPAAVITSPWIDDDIPAGSALKTDSPSFDATYAATGSTSIHFTSSSEARTFAFTAGSTPVTIVPGAADMLVFEALVNPCNPPRQILVTWRDTANIEYRATWGEDLVGTTAARKRVAPMPPGGEWAHMQVNAGALGAAGKTIKEIDVTVYGGELWIDAIGKEGCSLGRAEAPPADPLEQIWFDDDLPSGATTAPASGSETAWTWDTSQSASGARSHVEPVRTGTHQHVFDNATQVMRIAPGDVLFAYVLIDPCNPPREIMLQWNSGNGWYHRAFWGEDLIGWGAVGTGERYRAGRLPETGKWVRLEVPASAVGFESGPVVSMAFSVQDGRVWFDRVGKYSRVNLALNATATQSSTLNNDPTAIASRAIDGDPVTFNHTKNDAAPWLELDLGAVQPIETISIWNRTDCCTNRLRSYHLFVSDVPFTSKNVTSTISQPGVSTYSYPGSPNPDVDYEIHRTGRYIRLQMEPTDYLHVRELQVWAPAYPIRPTLSAGLRAVSESSQYDNWSWPHYAVNGLGNDRFQAGGSAAVTKNTDPNAWWEVDLGAAKPISEIEIVNRIDGYRDRLNQAYVLISTTPFTSKVLSETLAQPGVSIYSTGTSGGAVTHSFDVNRVGRYVRVQLANPNTHLQLTEVSVWGRNEELQPLAESPSAATDH